MTTETRRPLILIIAVLLTAVLGGLAIGLAGSAVADDYDDEIDKYQDQIDKAEDGLADANADKSAAQNRAEELESALEDTDAKIVDAAQKVEDLEAQVPALQKALDDAQAAVDAAVVQQGIVADKLDAAEAQDEAITEQIASDEEKVDELESLVAAIARESYKGGTAEESLGIVFGAADEDEFVDEFTAQQSASRVQASTLAELDELAAVNRNRGARQEAVREYITELKAQADQLVEERQDKEAEAQEAKKALDAKVDEAADAKAYLESQRDEYLAQQAENDRAQQEIADQVAALYQAKKKAEAGKSNAEDEKAAAEAKAAEEAAKGSGGASTAFGYFAYPTKNVHITSTYGMRYHPIFHYWRLHAGTDFRAYCGTPIYASAPGTVQWAKSVFGLGNQVMIDHGKVGGDYVMSSYNHLSSFAVSSGQKVSRGQLVGYSGTTGSSTACHLHFETWVNGVHANPMSLLG
ncbi:peptidoglycan DD-metalloendopeptidase family protein [Demequina sp. NBRC 110057]|uniref:peptidoglycan DD-metalloendopeptidase family protein n=1 Tax=Demequina sp. NBRC 110057 TaxID=1570346 RepID=UPI000A04AB04|nr:peptidoglycan DD-metalloendopeptidase family protein [Demequina sp. NBRC 110057]